MKLYIGVNQDGTGIISKKPIHRFFDEKTSDKEGDSISFLDTQQPPHWKVDNRNTEIPKNGLIQIGTYIIVTSELINKLAGKEMTWEDNSLEIEV